MKVPKFDFKITEETKYLESWLNGFNVLPDSEPDNALREFMNHHEKLDREQDAKKRKHEQWSFEDDAYKAERARIKKAFTERGLPDKKLAIFTLSWLAHYHRFYIEEVFGVRGHEAVFQRLLIWLADTYNHYGREFTAYRFRLSPQHDFNWLPKTGEVRELGYAYHPRLKMLLPVRTENMDALKAHLIKRHLRRPPDDTGPMVIRNPPRAKNRVK